MTVGRKAEAVPLPEAVVAGSPDTRSARQLGELDIQHQ